ncbi:hypothetical protein [Hymenobacter jejuensis]|uniref:Uncharacterized protein n=1 Tax=Hymenobacter jejuensis TaxID=2502781 RepID=A0A5B8A2N1_9BACT|nr:hypothetical protein [Hymenobacter jejuensis]QDA61661.1 hypothetical protein FHG12_16850 [Hymenobacter jejuensis]
MVSNSLYTLPKQYLPKAAFASLVRAHAPQGLLAVSACRRLAARFGPDACTAAALEHSRALNRHATANLRVDLVRAHARYFPVFGTFPECVRDEAGRVCDELVDEVSFLVFPPAGWHGAPAASWLLALGTRLSEAYSLDGFLYQPPGEPAQAHWRTATGAVDERVMPQPLTDPSQLFPGHHPPLEADFFRDITSEPGTAPNGGLQDYAVRQAGEFWVNAPAGDMQGAIRRYGEVFFRMPHLARPAG